MAKRLIRREKLVPDATHWVVATPENTTTYKPPPRNHELYALIGEIASRWSFIELQLDACIATLADLGPEITACITAQMMGHMPRCLTIKAIAHWRGLPEIVKAAEALQNKLHEASEFRNRAIHDRLLIETKSEGAFKDHRMSKKELHYGLKEFDKGQMTRAIELIDKRSGDCSSLLLLIREQ